MARRWLLFAIAVLAAATLGGAQQRQALIYPDRPNAIDFDPREAQYVRLVIRASSSGNEPCVDELEVYGPEGDRNLALASAGAKASASSCLSGYSIHAVEHLNDGEYGNARSWIAAGRREEWAQIRLPRPARVARVVFSRDRSGQYADRVPVDLEVRLSADGENWETVAALTGQVVSGGAGAEPVVPAPPPPPRLLPDGRMVDAEASASIEVPRADALGYPNLALGPAAQPAASSVYADGAMPIHQIRHLNDGLAGNSHSWISKGEPSWAEIDLGDDYSVYRVALGNDASGQYSDRAAISFRILAARSYSTDTRADVWAEVYRQSGGTALLGRTEFVFRPVRARWVRVAIEATTGGEARIDEFEIYGQKADIPPAEVESLLTPQEEPGGFSALLRYAFLGEEHAWLKTYGRADLDPTLVPYDGRVQEYPRHVGEDRLPLPPLSAAPKIDGVLDESCWAGASRGAVQVAAPEEFERGPMVTCSATAGVWGDDLYLAIETDRLLSSHLAVISAVGRAEAAALAVTAQGLVLRKYSADAQGQPHLDATVGVDGAFDRALKVFEARVPLTDLPGWQERGLRIGLGMGGTHTKPAGRPVIFTPAPLAVAEEGPCRGGRFRVRFAVPAGHGPVVVSGTAQPLGQHVTLQPGESKVLAFEAQRGPIGPQLNLDFVAEFSGGHSTPFVLHLFRYDPLERVLTLAEALADRLSAKGLDVSAERAELRRFREWQAALLSGPPDLAAERRTFFEARLAKRRLFFREPDLALLGSLLFVKRHPYLPSHIYTDYTDAPFRPGGGIYVLDIPTRDGRLVPEEATLRELFRTDTGIPRDPVASPNLDRIYFSFRPSADGFYHLMSMRPDGSDLRQLTDGPYHDLYPCPLPDGGLAFITTRCAARVFCFRWTASVLYRMNPDGSGMRPLSFASLSEWAPSVMRDGRIIWTRWEYIDKGADFSQTLWAINPDGTNPQLVFGNTINQPNGYACGREVPGSPEICCTLVSHFGDINGPIALVDPTKGRFNPKAITSLTPEVPWPGWWPRTECFRDPYPIAHDYFVCSHAPRDRFGLYVIDRFGNREVLYMDEIYGCMAPTPFRAMPMSPAMPDLVRPGERAGTFVLVDVYRGLEPTIERGRVKWLRVVEEVRHSLAANPNFDHVDFMKWYASPVDIVSGPFGWPTYTAKAPIGLVAVDEDGSACFRAPAGKVLYFQALDENFVELQRMRSVVQLQPGETRSCVGCHEPRNLAPPVKLASALSKPVQEIIPHEWGNGPFSYEAVVQPVLDRCCVACHDGTRARPDLRGARDAECVPVSYRSLISGGWVHVIDCGFKSGCEKRDPLTFGTVRSRLFEVLRDERHRGVRLTPTEELRLKTWIDLNCPLWPDYVERSQRALLVREGQ